MGLDARPQGLTRLILAIALPAIVTNITTPLLGLCDIAIAGHRGGAPFIAALAVATSMFNMLYWLLGFLRMGTSGVTAQACGAGNRSAQSIALWRGLLLALSAGVLLIVMQSPLALLMLGLMDVEHDTAAYAMRYFGIVVWGAPAMLSMYVFTGWFLGMQDTRISMWVSLLTDVVNIAVSVGLVFGLGLDIEGVALGTITAQWTAALVSAAVCARRFRPAWIPIRMVMSGSGISSFFRINSDIFLRTLCMVGVTVWFTRAGAEQGETMLAVNALLMQLFTLFSYFMDGFAFAGEALAGRWYGSGDRAMLMRTIRAELLTGLSMAILFTSIYFLAGEWVMSCLTSDGHVVEAARDYLPWVVTIPLTGCMAFCCDGLMIGLSRTRPMLASVAAGMVVYFALYLLLRPTLHNHALWMAFISYLAVRSVTLLLCLPRK